MSLRLNHKPPIFMLIRPTPTSPYETWANSRLSEYGPCRVVNSRDLQESWLLNWMQRYYYSLTFPNLLRYFLRTHRILLVNDYTISDLIAIIDLCDLCKYNLYKRWTRELSLAHYKESLWSTCNTFLSVIWQLPFPSVLPCQWWPWQYRRPLAILP